MEKINNIALTIVILILILIIVGILVVIEINLPFWFLEFLIFIGK